MQPAGRSAEHFKAQRLRSGAQQQDQRGNAARRAKCGALQSIIAPMPMPDLEIVCVDCGGACFPLTWRPEEGEVPDGEVVAYRCRDCLDRWDVVFSDDQN